MRKKRILFKLAGVLLAMIGVVIEIHIIPVSVWYIALIVLILVFSYLMLHT